MRKNFAVILIILVTLRVAIGCGTIINGGSQKIDIATTPADAEVWVDGKNQGKTPVRVTLKRREDYLIRISKEGYQDMFVNLSSKMSAWWFGNILFGGFIGCGVDLLSGGAWKLTPEKVEVNLSKLALLEERTIYIDEHQWKSLTEITFVNDNGESEVTIILQ